MSDLQVLRDLLGTESGNTWIAFMDYVQENLGAVLQRGRASQSTIEQSIIGQSGFSSWGEMIESPVSAGGLGWNLHSWNAWRRAYRVVLDYPYLRDLEISASAINTITSETKSSGFPATLEAFQAHQRQRTDDQTARQARSLAEAKRSAERATAAYTELRERHNVIQGQLQDEKRTTERLQREIGELHARIAAQEAEGRRLSDLAALGEAVAAIRARGGWRARLVRWAGI